MIQCLKGAWRVAGEHRGDGHSDIAAQDHFMIVAIVTTRRSRNVREPTNDGDGAHITSVSIVQNHVSQKPRFGKTIMDGGGRQTG